MLIRGNMFMLIRGNIVVVAAHNARIVRNNPNEQTSMNSLLIDTVSNHKDEVVRSIYLYQRKFPVGSLNIKAFRFN